MANKKEISLEGRVSGCPQGDTMTASMVVKELLGEIEDQGRVVVAYADNLIVIVRCPYLGTLMGITQRILRKVACEH